MAQVSRNQGDTFTVTLTAREHSVLKRWSDEHARSKAAQLEDVIIGCLLNKAQDYRQIDGPKFQDKYEALTAQQQADVDAILATAVLR